MMALRWIDCPEEGEGEQVMWKPIESAPKDGTRVLSYREGYAESMAVVWWNGTGCGAACWLPVNGAVWHSPTHWQPLPAPPQEQQ